VCIVVVMVDRTHEDRKAYFLEQLKIGDKWADYVAQQITDGGKYAHATPTMVAESEEQVAIFTALEKDILLDKGRTLEVKSRSIYFTGVDDYPFETVFVDTVEGWEAKLSHPVAVAVVSQKSGGIVVVPVSTASLWSVRRVFDSKRGFEVTVLECPKGLLRSFEEFLAWL
jgi:hypothetical protein